MGERFAHWFELSKQDFGNISISTCNASLSAFRDAYAASTTKAAISLGIAHSKDPVYALCQQHASCILENSTEWAKANLGASNLILGLLPTILAVIAPSMTEMAVLGVHRPLLSAIISISTPSILQGRVFYYEDPGEVLKTEYTRGDIRHPLAFGPWSTRSAALVGIVEFVLAAGILLNTLILVIQLANNSILSWGCTRTWPMFLWMFVPILIHSIASVGYSMTLKSKDARDRRPMKGSHFTRLAAMTRQAVAARSWPQATTHHRPPASARAFYAGTSTGNSLLVLHILTSAATLAYKTGKIADYKSASCSIALRASWDFCT